MRIDITNVGEHGVIHDMRPNQLAPNAWTNGTNVVMRELEVRSAPGYSTVLGTLSIAPTHVFCDRTATGYQWIYAGDAAIYSCDIDGTSHTDRTRVAGAYSTGKWNSCFLGGIPILNNGVDDPQAWPSGTDFADLANWPASTTCKVMRSFKSYLIAINVTESGTNNPWLIRTSHPAAAGAVPSTWDHTDATKLARRIELSQAKGHLVDGLQLLGDFYIYSERSVWRASEVGAPYVFEFEEAFDDFGVMSQDCVVDIGGQHVVFADHDLIIHDGHQKKSIIQNKNRQYLFSQIDPDNGDNCFVIYNKARSEVWFCYPSLGSTYPDKAYMWNHRTQETGFIDLPGIAHAFVGKVSNATETWDGDSGTWDTDLTTWNERTSSASVDRIVAADYTNTAAYRMDYGFTANGSTQVSLIEREDINHPELNKIPVKTVTAVYPEVDVPSDKTISVYVGSKFALDAGVDWMGPFIFNPDTDFKIDCLVTGRHISVRFRYNDTGSWGLSNYGLEVESAGMY